MSLAATSVEVAVPSHNQAELMQAHQLFAEQRPQQACELLKASTPDDSTDSERLLLLGRCSSALKQREQAEAYYRRAIASAPHDAGPRIELAGLLLAMRRGAEAGELLAQATQDSSGEAKTMLEQLAERLRPNDASALGGIDRGKPWSVQVYVGLTQDDNINAGPVSRSVPAVVGGVPVTFDLVQDALPHASTGAAMGINASYAIPLDDHFSLLFQGAWYGTGYFSRQDFNNDTTTLAAALIYNDKRYSLSLQPNMRYTRLDSRVQESSPGIIVRAARVLTETLSLTSTAGYAQRKQRTDSDRNVDIWQGGLGAMAQLTPALQVGGEYLWQREQAQLNIYSRRLAGPSVYAQYKVTPTLLLGANLSYTDIHYDAPMSLFPSPRSDRQTVTSLSALWDVSRYAGRNLVVRAQYSNIDNPSNIAYDNFRRNIFSLGVQTQF